MSEEFRMCSYVKFWLTWQFDRFHNETTILNIKRLTDLRCISTFIDKFLNFNKKFKIVTFLYVMTVYWYSVVLSLCWPLSSLNWRTLCSGRFDQTQKQILTSRSKPPPKSVRKKFQCKFHPIIFLPCFAWHLIQLTPVPQTQILDPPLLSVWSIVKTTIV